MTRCLDIHTHHPAPQPLGVISTSIHDFNPVDGQLYSVGIHPWTTADSSPTLDDWQKLENIAALPCVVAIGECGIDKIKGGHMYKQVNVMNRQIQISEKLGKPLIVHDVKAHDIIVGLRRDLEPKQNWLVHGFRAKPTVAKMLTDAGIYLSIGQQFNPASFASIPRDMLLAETDESPLSIEEIIAAIAREIEGPSEEDLKKTTDLILENTHFFLYKTKL